MNSKTPKPRPRGNIATTIEGHLSKALGVGYVWNFKMSEGDCYLPRMSTVTGITSPYEASKPILSWTGDFRTDQNEDVSLIIKTKQSHLIESSQCRMRK